jgi:hypothetical protein
MAFCVGGIRFLCHYERWFLSAQRLFLFSATQYLMLHPRLRVGGVLQINVVWMLIVAKEPFVVKTDTL